MDLLYCGISSGQEKHKRRVFNFKAWIVILLWGGAALLGCSWLPDCPISPNDHSPVAPPKVFVYTHTHAYIHIYIHTYIHTCIHTHIHTCIHTYIHIYICMYCIFTYILCIYTYTYIFIYYHGKLESNLPSLGWLLLNEEWCETLHAWKVVWDFTSHNNTFMQGGVRLYIT